MDQFVLDKIKEMAYPVLRDQGVELVDLLFRRERGRTVLRFLVDKPQGITLNECARINRQISQMLDAENLIQNSFLLEVASPGLDRKIESTRDFRRCVGKLVKIVLHQPLNKQNVWVGVVDKVDVQTLILRTGGGELIQIERDNIARANLKLEFG